MWARPRVTSGQDEIPAELRMEGQAVSRLAVVTDRFDRTSFHGLFAQLFLFLVFGLLEYVAVASVLLAGEIGRSGLATEVAIDALVVNVVAASHALGYRN